jgi:AcrR family transcriptional regulator
MSKKHAILQAATALFSIKGFKDASMMEVADMVGVAGATIFYHFKSKEDLFLSILADVKRSILEEFDRYFNDNKFETGLEMVEGTVSFYLYVTGKMEAQFRILHRHYPYELAQVNPICRGHLEAIYECFFDIFEQALRRGQIDGSIGDIQPRKTALLLFSMVDGLVRFKIDGLYESGTLYKELIESCRRMVSNSKSEQRG